MTDDRDELFNRVVELEAEVDGQRQTIGRLNGVLMEMGFDPEDIADAFMHE